MSAEPVGWEVPPPGAEDVFGSALPGALEYAHVLATTGVAWGVIGPREASRVWERHLLNCAVVGELIPRETHVVDVGSGAGLPGIPLALARSDLRVELVEPMQRRVDFLHSCVDTLALSNVVVTRARAEDLAGRDASLVVARAVAPLAKLVRLTLPMLTPGGCLLALKGASAADEIERDADAIRRVGGSEAELFECGAQTLSAPVRVVRVHRTD